jgi:SpoVK/Ycf46/Vps4 family AAA+-type ATPase
VNFFVDEVRPVEWNDEAYTHLVYDEQQKDLILTFVKNHQSSPKRSDDVIAGKGTSPPSPRFGSFELVLLIFCPGQGLIVLLSGPPGTGKTLTAEAGM